MHEKLKNSTVITIAHRLNTVKNCDVILVLREGQVAELDTIGSLMGREGGCFMKWPLLKIYSFNWFDKFSNISNNVMLRSLFVSGNCLAVAMATATRTCDKKIGLN